jgi:hypothetical protein
VLVHYRIGGPIKGRAAIHALDKRMACRETGISYGLLSFIAQPVERGVISGVVLNAVRQLREKGAQRIGACTRIKVRLQVVRQRLRTRALTCRARAEVRVRRDIQRLDGRCTDAARYSQGALRSRPAAPAGPATCSRRILTQTALAAGTTLRKDVNAIPGRGLNGARHASLYGRTGRAAVAPIAACRRQDSCVIVRALHAGAAEGFNECTGRDRRDHSANRDAYRPATSSVSGLRRIVAKAAVVAVQRRSALREHGQPWRRGVRGRNRTVHRHLNLPTVTSRAALSNRSNLGALPGATGAAL